MLLVKASPLIDRVVPFSFLRYCRLRLFILYIIPEVVFIIHKLVILRKTARLYTTQRDNALQYRCIGCGTDTYCGFDVCFSCEWSIVRWFGTLTLMQFAKMQYLHRKSLHDKPTVHLAYDEGLHVLREFLQFAGKNPVEDLQEFTRQRVPSPYWVRNETANIPDEYLASAAKTLIAQLGPKGIDAVGGKEWWQWRGPAESLRGEWIEMRSDYNQKKKVGEGHFAGRNRVVLYLHGGAYFFGSIETHRYQIQRHARKLKARIFTRYVFEASLCYIIVANLI